MAIYQGSPGDHITHKNPAIEALQDMVPKVLPENLNFSLIPITYLRFFFGLLHYFRETFGAYAVRYLFFLEVTGYVFTEFSNLLTVTAYRGQDPVGTHYYLTSLSLRILDSSKSLIKIIAHRSASWSLPQFL
jgi:hypothetical protein